MEDRVEFIDTSSQPKITTADATQVATDPEATQGATDPEAKVRVHPSFLPLSHPALLTSYS
jgi:hypothetical protein